MSSQGLLSVCVCVLISSSYKDTSHIGLRPILVASFYLNCLFKDCASNTVVFWGTMGEDFSLWMGVGDTVQKNHLSLMGMHLLFQQQVWCVPSSREILLSSLYSQIFKEILSGMNLMFYWNPFCYLLTALRIFFYLFLWCKILIDFLWLKSSGSAFRIYKEILPINSKRCF